MADYCAQLERFVRLHGRDMVRVREHLEVGEPHLAHDVVHNVRGIAQLIGAKRIALRAAQLAQQLRSGTDHASAISLAHECEVEFTNLLEIIRTQPLASAANP